MKKGFYAILAALTVFALVITACPPDGGDGGGETKSNVATFTKIKLANGPETSPQAANRSETLAGIRSEGDIFVSQADAPAAKIAITFSNNYKGTAKIAKKAGAITEGDFSEDYNPNKEYNFADEDKLYVKVTSEDGSKTNYYGFQVLVGRDISLASVSFWNEYTVPGKDGNPDTTGKDEIRMVDGFGAPVAELADFTGDEPAETGRIQFGITQPTDGFNITVTPNDTAATVVISANGTDWTTLANGAKYPFADTADQFLYIKVTSSNGRTTRYYKISVALKRAINIPYGTPATVDADNPDAIWETGATEWVPINRSNVTEGTGWLDMPVEDRSVGQAKLMWDETGVWVYAQVWEKTVSSVPGDHTKSSVELFVHESYPDVIPTSTANVTSGLDAQQNGGQYRLGANGERSGSPATGAVDYFDALGNYSAKKKTLGAQPAELKINDLTAGYVVIFQAPWLFPAEYLLDDSKNIKADKKIGVELQVNATGNDGSRAGVLNWNNITSGSYGSLADYGEAILKLPAAGAGSIGALKPRITKQPMGGLIATDATGFPELSVAARSVDGGTLSFQWYKTTSLTATGTAVGTASAGIAGTGDAANVYTSTYTPTDAIGAEGDTYFYYAEVTNAVTGKTSGKAKSTVVKFTVGLAGAPLVIDNPTIAANGGAGFDNDGYVIMSNGAGNKADGRGEYDSLPNYAFPTDADLSSYTHITLTYSTKSISGDNKDFKAILKKKADNWDSTTPAVYPTFETGEDKEIKWDISLFEGGFSLQYNGGDNADLKWGLKITKITFSKE